MAEQDQSQTHFQSVLDDIEHTREIGQRLPWISLTAAIIWWGGAIGTVLALIGLEALQDLSPLLVGASGLILILPGFLMIMAGLMARSSRQSREANALVLSAATRLLMPGQIARGEAEAMADATRRSAGDINKAMADALAALKSMSDALSSERLRVESVAYATADNARDLTERLSEERRSLEVIAKDLKAQIELMGDAIPRQARMMVDAAKTAKLEVSDADSALEGRITKLQGASAGLATRLESLNRIAEDATKRTQLVHQAVTSVEDKLAQSVETVSRAEQASEMAVSAVKHVGEALETAVSSALDGARYASAEITERSDEARKAAELAVADLRTAGRDASQALRELRAYQHDTERSETTQDTSATLRYDPDGLVEEAKPARFDHDILDPSSIDEEVSPEGSDGDPDAVGDDIFEADTTTPAIITEPDTSTSEPEDPLFDTDDSDLQPPAFLSGAPIHSERPSLSEALVEPEETAAPLGASPIALEDPIRPADLKPAPAAADTAWRDILADLDDEGEPKRKPTASSSAPLTAPMGREETAEALIERLTTSGIRLPQTFKSKDKKKIASAARQGEEARRTATRTIAGREVDRVEVRLRKDKSLQEMAVSFLSAEEEDALRTLEETSRTGRNASSRLSAYLLIDAALA